MSDTLAKGPTIAEAASAEAGTERSDDIATVPWSAEAISFLSWRTWSR